MRPWIPVVLLLGSCGGGGMKDPKLPDLVTQDSEYASLCEWTKDAKCEARVGFACGGSDPHDNGSCSAKLPCSEDICIKREPHPPPPKPPTTPLRPGPTHDTTAAPSAPPIVVEGEPSANRSIKARGVDLGLLLLLAATQQEMSVAALDATTLVSADLHYADGLARARPGRQQDRPPRGGRWPRRPVGHPQFQPIKSSSRALSHRRATHSTCRSRG